MENTLNCVMEGEECLSRTEESCGDGVQKLIFSQEKKRYPKENDAGLCEEPESGGLASRGYSQKQPASANSFNDLNHISADGKDSNGRDSSPSSETVDYGISELPSPLKYLLPPLSISEDINDLSFMQSFPTKIQQDLEDYRQKIQKLEEELERYSVILMLQSFSILRPMN